jgi:hypothetical protein
MVWHELKECNSGKMILSAKTEEHFASGLKEL